jgi:hypothetical protein
MNKGDTQSLTKEELQRIELCALFDLEDIFAKLLNDATLEDGDRDEASQDLVDMLEDLNQVRVRFSDRMDEKYPGW